jgi:hypothetical protein
MKSITEIGETLLKPFPREDIEFRVYRVSGKSPKAQVLAYITARGIMQRLDEVFGINGWQDVYEILQGGVKCSLTVKIGDEAITKEDAASSTNVEPLKGAFSDSLKRAGVKFGIGRYLYDLPDCWVDLMPDKPLNARNPIHYYASDTQSGWWEEPDLPTWALRSSQDSASKPNSAAPPAEPDTSLAEKVKLLLDKNLLTESKYQQLMRTITEKSASQALMRHISSQMDILLRWDNISLTQRFDTTTRRDLYNRILSANGKALTQISSELDSYEKGRAA